MEVTFLPITDTALSSSACRRAVMKTYAPSSTNLFAVAKPIPLLPPVMTASHTEVESKRHGRLSITHNSSLDSGCLPQECHY
jgi:predicted anti-sigma-YlaC factor YlaD